MAKSKKTDVVFRRWERHIDENQGVLALFPDVPDDDRGVFCMSYEHVGQHGAASYDHCILNSRPASMDDADVFALYAELTRIGYDLHVKQRSVYGYRHRRAVLAKTGELQGV